MKNGLHFEKVFSGISSVNLSEDQTKIVSLLSTKNGETLEEMFCPVKPGTKESECSSANKESIAKQYRMVE